MLKKLLSVAIFIVTCSGAMAQGQLPAGNVWGNPLASGAPAKPSTVTAILDRALGSTRGSILERSASGWAIVGPGATAGLAWISAGTGADPAYGILGLSGGGCNAALVASNGGMLYSTASACAILAGTATARLPLLSGASTTPVWGAYTLPASVISGGIPFFSSASAEGSSALLVANQIMLGGGAGVAPATLGSLGTTVTVLHGNAAGPPAFGAINLTTDVSNQLPFANGGCNGTTQQSCFDNAAPTPTRAGDLAYWNGTHWVTLAGNNSGTQILTENASGVPSWAATGSVSSVTCGTGLSGGTITISGTCAVSLTSITNSLGTNAAIATGGGFVDGPSIAQGTSGTWWASGGVTITDTAGNNFAKCKLWDGTTVIDSRAQYMANASSDYNISLSGALASPVANIKISCSTTAVGATTTYRFNDSGASKDSTVSAHRIQ